MKTRSIITTTSGTHRLIVSLNTKELNHLFGTVEIQVRGATKEDERAAAPFSSASASMSMSGSGSFGGSSESSSFGDSSSSSSESSSN